MSITGDLERLEREQRAYRQTTREARLSAGRPINPGSAAAAIALQRLTPVSAVSSGVSPLPAVTHDSGRMDIDACRPSCLITINDTLPARERRYEAMLYNPTTRDSVRTVLYASDPAALAVKVARLFGADVELAGWHPAVTTGELSPS